MAVTQRQMSKALGLGTTRINQLIDEGILIRDETARNGQVMLLESLKNYFLSKNAALDGDANVNFWKERGLHEKAKRELAELKLAKNRGELYEAEVVERVLSELLTNFRSKMTGLPSKFAPQLAGKDRSEIYKIMTVAIEELLTELADGLESVTFENGDDIAQDAVEGDPTN